jgi:hypothetical protein
MKSALRINATIKTLMRADSNQPLDITETNQPKLNHGMGPRKNGAILRKKYTVNRHSGR